MDFLKELGLPNIGLIFRALLGILLIGIIVGTFSYFINHPLVFVLVAAGLGALIYFYIRHRRNKNKV